MQKYIYKTTLYTRYKTILQEKFQIATLCSPLAIKILWDAEVESFETLSKIYLTDDFFKCNSWQMKWIQVVFNRKWLVMPQNTYFKYFIIVGNAQPAGLFC